MVLLGDLRCSFSPVAGLVAMGQTNGTAFGDAGACGFSTGGTKARPEPGGLVRALWVRYTTNPDECLPAWLSVLPREGELLPGADQPFALSFDCGQLVADGSYSEKKPGTICLGFQDDGGDALSADALSEAQCESSCDASEDCTGYYYNPVGTVCLTYKGPACAADKITDHDGAPEGAFTRMKADGVNDAPYKLRLNTWPTGGDGHVSGATNDNAFGVPGDGAAKKCDTVLEGKAIHWTEHRATGDYGPYLEETVGEKTQDECIAACEANDECAAWAFRVVEHGTNGQVHNCWLLSAAFAGYAPGADAGGEINSGVCYSPDEQEERAEQELQFEIELKCGGAQEETARRLLSLGAPPRAARAPSLPIADAVFEQVRLNVQKELARQQQQQGGEREITIAADGTALVPRRGPVLRARGRKLLAFAHDAASPKPFSTWTAEGAYTLLMPPPKYGDAASVWGGVSFADDRAIRVFWKAPARTTSPRARTGAPPARATAAAPAPPSARASAAAR